MAGHRHSSVATRSSRRRSTASKNSNEAASGANPCFEVRDLRRYYRGKLALSVPSLRLERGELIFLLGESGCGKTTFLETLGLLSHSFDRSDTGSVLYYSDRDRPPIDYRDAWRDEAHLARIRLDNFSFMFQQANLLAGHTIGENVALSSLIQGQSFDDAMRSAKEHLKLVIQQEEFDSTSGDPIDRRRPEAASGGQAQRAAFARAIGKRFRVLMADEPTGNVGPEDAWKVMTLVWRAVKMPDPAGGDAPEDRTAVIVTHNLDLALLYADTIVVMSSDGVASNSHVFRADPGLALHIPTPEDTAQEALIQKRWAALGTESRGIKEQLLRRMHAKSLPPTPTRTPSASSASTIGHTPPPSQRAFRRWFHRNTSPELRAWGGQGRYLCLMLTLVLLALGIVWGGLSLLAHQMSDPYVRWVNVYLSHSSDRTVADSLAAHAEALGVEEVFPYSQPGTYVRGADGGRHYVRGRTIEPHDPLRARILATENRVDQAATTFPDSTSLGWIITEELACRLDPDGRPRFVPNVAGRADYQISVPVVAIVKSLPSRKDFICQEAYHDQYVVPGGPFARPSTDFLSFFAPGERASAVEASEALQEAIRGQLGPGHRVLTAGPTRDRQGWDGGHLIRIKVRPQLAFEQWQNLGQTVADTVEHATRVVPPGRPHPRPDRQRADVLSVLISDIDRADSLMSYLAAFNLDIDRSTIESHRNYRTIAGLTWVTAIALVLVSIVGISVFLGKLLADELRANRVIIGLFVAMGVRPSVLRRLYARRVAEFLLSCLVVSGVIVAVLVGSGGLSIVLGRLSLGGETARFEIFNWWLLLFLCLLIIVAGAVTELQTRYFLGHCPGDLLYDRVGRDKRTTGHVGSRGLLIMRNGGR